MFEMSPLIMYKLCFIQKQEKIGSSPALAT
jgi:hypothetical protein